ncbi:MAG: hypothetical protein ACRDKG_06075 [Actinomycetota bacterium]
MTAPNVSSTEELLWWPCLWPHCGFASTDDEAVRAHEYAEHPELMAVLLEVLEEHVRAMGPVDRVAMMAATAALRRERMKRKWEISTATGLHTVGAADADVSPSGTLYLRDDAGILVAVFAPDSWWSATPANAGSAGEETDGSSS